MLTVVSFLALIVTLIFVHEIGHFIAAKRSKVKVEEFGLGFPPRLLSIKRGDTVYSLNLIPLGGFVKLAGEEDPSVPGSLASQSVGTRFFVLSSGSIMNILLAFFLLSLSFMIPRQEVMEEVRIERVAPGSPAEIAGMLPGDRILKIDNHPIQNRADLVRFINLKLGSEVTIQLQKADLSYQEVTLVPRWKPPPGEGAIGIIITGTNSTLIIRSYPFGQAIFLGLRWSAETLILLKNELVGSFIRWAPPQVIGPVGIAQLTGEVAKSGIGPLLQFGGLVSLVIALVNLFPVPGLDGGRLLFVALEWVRRGKRISPKKEALIHFIGFALLIVLILVVSYYDIMRFIRGESLLP